MTNPISLYIGMAKSLEDCPPPEEREARLKMVMAADALRKAADHIDAQDAKIKALVEAVKTGRDYVHDFSIGQVAFTDGTPMDMDMVADDLVRIDATLAAAKEPT